MSEEKKLNSRIQQKHDIEANWRKAVNFIPFAGEIIVYDKESEWAPEHLLNPDGTKFREYPILYPRFKVGDGSTKVNSLPFVSDVSKLVQKAPVYKATPYDIKEIISQAEPGSTIILRPKSSTGADYERLDLTGIKAFPENLTIEGYGYREYVRMAGISITSGIKDNQINTQRVGDLSFECVNADISNAIMPKGLTIRNITFTDSFCLRNCSIDDLTIENCNFTAGAFINIDPNHFKDYYGNDYSNPNNLNLEYRPQYATLYPKNLIIRDCTFAGEPVVQNSNPNATQSVIRVIGYDGIVIYRNFINGVNMERPSDADLKENPDHSYIAYDLNRFYNGIQVNGNVNAKANLNVRCRGKIFINNNVIRNTASRSIRINGLEDAEVCVLGNTLEFANMQLNQRDNIDVIKASSALNTTFNWGIANSPIFIQSTYQDMEFDKAYISLNNRITASATNTLEDHVKNSNIHVTSTDKEKWNEASEDINTVKAEFGNSNEIYSMNNWVEIHSENGYYDDEWNFIEVIDCTMYYMDYMKYDPETGEAIDKLRGKKFKIKTYAPNNIPCSSPTLPEKIYNTNANIGENPESGIWEIEIDFTETDGGKVKFPFVKNDYLEAPEVTEIHETAWEEIKRLSTTFKKDVTRLLEQGTWSWNSNGIADGVYKKYADGFCECWLLGSTDYDVSITNVTEISKIIPLPFPVRPYPYVLGSLQYGNVQKFAVQPYDRDEFTDMFTSIEIKLFIDADGARYGSERFCVYIAGYWTN